MALSFPQSPRKRGSLSIGIVIAAVALISYFSSGEQNSITGKTQYLAMSRDQEIALGIQTAPAMAQQYGGLSRDAVSNGLVVKVGNQLITASDVRDTKWRFQFHLLADDQTINAFALPGGQVFITQGLFNRLQTEGQLAGVLAHEIGHVVGRHGAAQLAKQKLSQGLTAATVVATGDQGNGQLAAMAGQLLTMQYGRGDELESDQLAVRFMSQAGYDPRAMLDVLEILKEAGGPGGPEFFSTHPNPDNRIEQLQQAIHAQFPDGVPDALSN